VSTIKLPGMPSKEFRASQILWLLLALALFGLLAASISSQASAQSDDDDWTTPVNLSHSGAASEPTIVVNQDGDLLVFWWDQFDGVTVAQGKLEGSSSEFSELGLWTWSEPEPVPIYVVSFDDEGEPIYTPVTAMPRIVGDAAGFSHAFWLGEENEDTGAQPLLSSHMAKDELSWSRPITVAKSAVSFDVTGGVSATVHLAYIRDLHNSEASSGIYYQRSDDSGATWSNPVTVHESQYLRQLLPETAHLRMTIDDNSGVYITWDDPHLERAALAYSPDGESEWQALRTLGGPQDQPREGRLAPIPGGDVLVLWDDAQFGGQCNLYQALASEVLAGSPDNARRVLEDLLMCSPNDQFFSTNEGQVILATGGDAGILNLVAWDGTSWSEPKQLNFAFEDPELERPAYLGNLRIALDHRLPGRAQEVLLVVGTDQRDDVWFTSSQTDALGVTYAPAPPWSQPVSLYDSPTYPGLPAIATDAEGRIHILWADAEAEGEPGIALLYTRGDISGASAHDAVRWSRPMPVLGIEGGVSKPALAVTGDRLHAVWQSDLYGEILYSRAFTRDAHSVGGWDQSQNLLAPSTIGSSPHIVIGAQGALHVVYAVPVNDGRGIYYTRSDDEGQNWSEAVQVFDAAAAGWVMADSPCLTVDSEGIIYAAWVRTVPQVDGLPRGIYYAYSADGGETWSQAGEVVEGVYALPQLATSTTDQVHLVWNEATQDAAWWDSQFAVDSKRWMRPERIQALNNVPGPVSLVADRSGGLHLVGVGLDDAAEPALIYTSWDGAHWSDREAFRLETGRLLPGVAAALQPDRGRLEVAIRSATEELEESEQIHVWHTARSVLTETADLTSTPPITPEQTTGEGETPSEPTASLTSTKTSAPTATLGVPLDIGGAPPPGASGFAAMTEPLLLAGGLAALLVVGILGLRLLWASRR
jgi:hypothetical protein